MVNFFSLPLSFIWFISCLAEINRTPFDFAEGESELVSMFNVEYGGGGFALIFLAEYASIFFYKFTILYYFLRQRPLFSPCLFTLTFLLFVWVRGIVPRFRYDKLMYLAWKRFLPLSLSFISFCWC